MRGAGLPVAPPGGHTRGGGGGGGAGGVCSVVAFDVAPRGTKRYVIVRRIKPISRVCSVVAFQEKSLRAHAHTRTCVHAHVNDVLPSERYNATNASGSSEIRGIMRIGA